MCQAQAAIKNEVIGLLCRFSFLNLFRSPAVRSEGWRPHSIDVGTMRACSSISNGLDLRSRGDRHVGFDCIVVCFDFDTILPGFSNICRFSSGLLNQCQQPLLPISHE